MQNGKPVEPYRVDRILSDNNEIHTGSRTLKVVHTPGHTLGHISLYEPEDKVLICGDLFHKNDIGWLNIFREGIASIQRSIESLDRLATLQIKQAYSGHGPRWFIKRGYIKVNLTIVMFGEEV